MKFNSGKKKLTQTYTSPSAAEWRSRFDSNELAQLRAYSSPYNNGIYKNNVTSIDNAPAAYLSYVDNGDSSVNSNTSWLNASKIAATILSPAIGVVSHLGDFPNTFRALTQDMLKSAADSDKADIDDAELGLKDILLIRDYSNLVSERDSIIGKMHDAESFVGGRDSEYYQGLKLKVDDLNKKILGLDDYFKGDGRRRDVIADLMYDKSNLSFGDKARINSEFASKDTWSHDESNPVKKLGKFIADIPKFLVNEVQLGAHYLGKAANAVGLDNNKYYDDSITREVLKSDTAPLDLIDLTYRKNATGVNASKLNEYEKLYNKIINQKTVELNQDRYAARSGYLTNMQLLGAIPLAHYLYDGTLGEWSNARDAALSDKNHWMNSTHKFYDPEDIPKSFLDAKDKIGDSLVDMVLNPLYSAVQMASSITMMKHTIDAMSIDGLLNYAAKKIPYIGVATTAASVATSLDATVKSRQQETGMEKIQALSDRAYAELVAKRANIGDITDRIKYIAHQKGIDTTDMDLRELISIGVAYNMFTGDKDFELTKTDIRSGINKLVNANNALAIKDYMQSLPFYSFGGKAMNKFAEAAVNNSFSRGAARLLSKSLRNAPKIPGAVLGDFAKVEYTLPTFSGIFDSTVDKLANRFIRKDVDSAVKFANNAAKGLYTKSLGNYLKHKADLLLFEGTSEAIEEGQQLILQDRYGRGLYDNYNRAQNMFDVDEIFNNVGLAGESLLAYFGLKPFDKNLNTEEIRKAMNIGFISSVMQSGLMHSAKNLIGTHDDTNIRSLAKLMKADRTTSLLIGKHFNDYDDLRHLNMFYDAFRKGITDEKLMTSMTRLRDNMDENEFVTKDNMNADILLMKNAYKLYSNKELRDALKDSGVEPFSDKYKSIITTGAKRITDYQMSVAGVADNEKEVNSFNSDRSQAISELFNGALSEEQLADIEKNNPKLAATVKKLSSEFDSTLAKAKEESESNKKRFISNLNNFFAFKDNEHVVNYVREHHGSEKLGKAAREEELTRAFNDKKIREAAINYAYETEKRNTFDESVKDANSFVNNKYVRQYVDSIRRSGESLNKALSRIWGDEENRKEAIDAARDNWLNLNYNKELFVKDRVAVLSLYKLLKSIRNIKKIAKDRKAFLELVRKEMGLDIDTEKIKGMIDELSDIENEHKEREDGYLGNKKGSKIRHSYDDLFEDDIESYELDNDDDFQLAINRYFVNRAALNPLRAVMQAYTTIGNKKLAPELISLNNAINGRNSSEGFLSDDVKGYKQLLQVVNGQTGVDDEHIDKRDARRLMFKMSKEAAIKFVLNELNDSEHRYRIANRMWQDAPITQEDMNDAADGDNEANDKIDKHLKLVEVEIERRLQEGQLEDLEDNSEENEQIDDDLKDQLQGASTAEDELAGTYLHRNKKREERKKKKKQEILNSLSKGVVENEDEEEGDEDALSDDEYDDSDDEDNSDNGVELTHNGEFVPAKTTKTNEVILSQPKNEQDNSNDSKSQEDTEEDNVDDGDMTDQLLDQLDEDIDDDKDDQSDLDLQESLDNDLEEYYVDLLEQQDAAAIEALVATEERKANEAASVIEQGAFQEIEDPSMLDVEDYGKTGRVKYKGEVLSEKQSKQLMDELIILGKAEIDGFDQEDLPDGSISETPQYRLNATNSNISSFVSNTFFYQPNPDVDQETGEDLLMKLTVNGKLVKLNKPLASGRVLSLKLSTPGWLQSAKKYYIVTQSLQARDNTLFDDSDSMTVSLILEDDEHTYATSLRSLGEMVSDVNGDPDSKYRVSLKKNLIDRLVAQGVDFNKILEPGQSLPKKFSARAKLARNAINKKEMELAKSWWMSQGRSEELFETWWKNKPLKKNYHKSEHNTIYKQDLSTWRNVHTLFKILARKYYQMPGKKILTEDAIKDQIQALQSLRNDIINRYLDKEYLTVTEDGKLVKRLVYKFPAEVRTDVTPMYVQLSNGVINNTDEFRVIGDIQNPSIDDVQRDINNGNILLGFGKGVFAGSSEQYSIQGLLSKDEDVVYHGKGLSGKIYWLVKGLSNSDTRVPIMLHEEKFDTLEVAAKNGKTKTKFIGSPEDVELALAFDPLTRELVNSKNDGTVPSAAEILLYMLCRRFDFGTTDLNKIAEIIEFFIHSGERTLLRNQPKVGEDPMNFLASKQLFFGKISEDEPVKLHIGIGSLLNGFQLQSFTPEEIFADTEDGIKLRKTLVHAIATLMHWNTDREFMNKAIEVGNNTSVINGFIQHLIGKYYNSSGLSLEEQLDKSISILGNKQLSFKVRDFFKLSGNGKKIEPKKNVSILAWMIKNKKISTDVGQNVFKDPFVFGFGAQGGNQTAPTADGSTNLRIDNTSNKQPAKEIKSNKPKSSKQKEGKQITATLKVNTGFSIINPDLFNNSQPTSNEKQIALRRNMGFKSPENEEEREQYRLKIEQGYRRAAANGGLQDRIYITDAYVNKNFSKFNLSQINSLIDKMKETVLDFLDKYNKQYGTDYKIDNIEGITTNTALTLINLARIGNGYLHLDLYKNGNGKLMFTTGSVNKTWSTPVTGVYSKNKSKGKFDKDKAVTWLQDHLGINRYNIIVRNGVMRSTDNELIFGVTLVSLDKIAGELTGMIMLSKDGGEGVTYHEAWHYVNLLLNDKHTRLKIWDSYAKDHKELQKKGVANLLIEEALADAFVKYITEQLDKSLSGIVKRLFNNVLDFVVVSRRKSAYRNLFKSIKSGDFKNSEHLDLESAKEFADRYKNGVKSIDYSVSGYTKEELDKLNYIDNHTDLFNTLQSVIRKIVSDFNIDSVDKLKRLSGAYDSRSQVTFKAILEKIDDMIDSSESDQYADMLSDIRDNPEFLRRKLIETFSDFGINVKIKHDEEENESEKREDAKDFEFDKFDLSVSKKDNAAMRVKMFMYSIPKYKVIENEDGSQTVINETDGFGSNLFWDFNEAWTKILGDLWQASSLDDKYQEDFKDKDGNILYRAGDYKYNSIYGMVYKRAESDVFYKALKDKLDSLTSENSSDAQLRSQLYATINSSKPTVMYIKISDPIERLDDEFEDILDSADIDSSLYQFLLVADVMRQWRFNDDSLISAQRNIARNWSKNLASNGLIKFDESKGSVVSSTFVNNRNKELKNLTSSLVKLTLKRNGRYVNNQDYVRRALTVGIDGNPSIKEQVIKFLNKLGIDQDKQSLDIFVALGTDKKMVDDYQYAEILLKALSSTDKSKGGFGFIVGQQLINAIGEGIILSELGSEFDKDLDLVFNNYNSLSIIARLASAWNAAHPSPAEFSAKGPNGEMYYPISQNNYISDKIRNLNDKESGEAEKLRKDPYSEHSILLDVSDSVDKLDPSTLIKINTFVGLKDGNRLNGGDYFGITAMEDYLSKLFMTESDQLIFPTMADKKTWNSLTSKNLKLQHDVLIVGTPKKLLMNFAKLEFLNNNRSIISHDSEGNVIETPIDQLDDFELGRAAYSWFELMDDNNPVKRHIYEQANSYLLQSQQSGFNINDLGTTATPRFSNGTIQIFSNYILSEINSLIQYYSKDNIKYLINNPNKLLENFHGKVKDGRMDFSGNGGKMRYFYDVPTANIGRYVFSEGTNINLALEMLFNLLKNIEDSKVAVNLANPAQLTIKAKLSDIRSLSGDSEELDGFELIRAYLDDLKKSLFKEDLGLTYPRQEFTDSINEYLVNKTLQELLVISQPGPLLLVENKDGQHLPKYIPAQFLEVYRKLLSDSKLFGTAGIYNNKAVLASTLFSLIGNYVVNSQISTIEIEKVFSGDPAQYKWKGSKTSKSKVTAIINGNTYEIVDKVLNLSDLHSDKIKRLGSMLSPGLEVRNQYNGYEEILLDIPNHTKYTVLDIEDVKAPSLFYELTKQNFKVLLVVDKIRNGKVDEYLDKFTDQLSNELYDLAKEKKGDSVKYKRISVNNVIDLLYSDADYFNRFYNMLPKDLKENIESDLDLQMSPYKKINVCDALVMIRPDLYRRIRIGLGEWSFEPDETGYSDQLAYDIIENGYYINEDGRHVDVDPSEWMKNTLLALKVSKLLLFPLKMSYFENESINEGRNSRNRALLNKMAIFPVFKFNKSTDSGSLIYDRMNKAGNELDMIVFKSAAKVGAVQNGLLIISKDKTVKTGVSDISDELSNDSDTRLDYETGEVINKEGNGSLAVKVLDLNNLRLQLNTHAHEVDSRSIGTQMFKLASSNIVDDEKYGSGSNRRLGRVIRRDITNSIKLLTLFGVDDVKDRFFTSSGRLNSLEVRKFVEDICESNGLGISAKQIIHSGGVIASLPSRGVFENSVSLFVNRLVVNINTKGGTAIQQSVLGFVAFNRKKNILTQEEAAKKGFIEFNDGKELKWNKEDNSTLVLLSENFFRDIVPAEYKGNFEATRQWLLDHNIIGENAKPFGVGYRIPTQGQSSMFAAQVADILPKQNGDLIIVPREFTGQTGSDFDVDKLFLALKKFDSKGKPFEIGEQEVADLLSGAISKDDVIKIHAAKDLGINPDEFDKYLESLNDIQLEKLEDYYSQYNIEEAVKNHLLDNYILILTDKKNFSLARGSIDVITELLQEELIKPYLKDGSSGYAEGGYQLLPSFQTLRKLEFSVGKTGIGPFALNVTNLSLTQLTGLTLRYDKNNAYGFGSLDAIYGEDDRRIADWLSAMVNANVDVAKDPYVFALNVNQTTYKHTNFLIRAGKGLATFTFLTQPSIKQFANIMNNAGNVYGFNLSGEKVEGEFPGALKSKVAKLIYSSLLRELKLCLNNILDEEQTETVLKFIKYVNKLIKGKKESSEEKVFRPFDKKSMFNIEIGIQSLKSAKADYGFEKAVSLAYLACALESFLEIYKYADKLSDLVKASLIDTKKFGNSIAKQINFSNTVDVFKNTIGFYINKPGFDEKVEQYIKELKSRGILMTKQQAESRFAIDMYYKNTFLGSKFYNAINLTRYILSALTFTATRLFDNIFRNIAGQVNGFVDVSDNKGTVNYSKISDEKKVTDIAESVDNAIRFLSFFGIGSKLYGDPKFRQQHPDAIDFTFGGDVNALKNKIKDILFGNENQKDIFFRFRSLVNDIVNHPENYPGLVDPESLAIQNELLLYLNPITANSKSPVGRFSLSLNQMTVGLNKKLILSSAFALLLSYQNEEVLKLAQDLVFYAYYSSYDQNGINSFFDLVPTEYRALYDNALSHSIYLMNKDNSEMLDALTKLYLLLRNNDLTDRASNIIDIISRNYWYNDNIVKTYYINESDSVLLDPYGKDVLGLPVISTNNGNKAFPSFITTSNIDNSYIKIKSGSEYMLYKCIGSVIKTKNDEDSDKHIGDSYVYCAVNKAGYRGTGTNILEMYDSFGSNSIFEQNKLDSEFAQDKVMKDVQKMVDDSNKANDGYSFELVWYDKPIQESLSSNYDNYIKPTPITSELKTVNVGSVKLNAGKSKPDAFGIAKADVVINLTPSEEKSDDDLKTVFGEDNKAKTISIGINEDVSKYMSNILKLVNKDGAVIHFTTSSFDYLFENAISKEDIDKYIEEELDRLSLTYDKYNLKDKELLLQQNKELLEQYKAKRVLMLRKMYEFVNELLDYISANEVNIDHISTSSTKYNGSRRFALSKAVSTVSNLRSNLFSNKNQIYVHKNLSSDKKSFKNYIKELNYEIEDYKSYAERLEESAKDQLLDYLTNQMIDTDNQLIEAVKNNISDLSNPLLGGIMNSESEDDFLGEVQEDIEESQDDLNSNKC
ncbi:hypothetical protein [uncultured phage cr61_1]|uniref:Uncharacterized protein n=1 Tax=uncultured phage cr61_1 TaxID=2986417 RepID=A0AAE7RXP9_9CAUD|nr:hypothetical protein OJM08_gp27 [uncultured phage cr61_1]QWM90615.1 hypothetical protein [uncultured phage cr61_1]